jgi:predicted amino acid-binding ACT domain protein
MGWFTNLFQKKSEAVTMSTAKTTMEADVFRIEQPFRKAKGLNAKMGGHKSAAKKMLDVIRKMSSTIKSHQKTGLSFLLRARKEFRLSDIDADVRSRTQINRVMAGIRTELSDVEKNVRLMLDQQQAELGSEMNQFNLDDDLLRKISERTVNIDKIHNDLKQDFANLKVVIENDKYSEAFAAKNNELVSAARNLEKEVEKAVRVVRIAKLKAHNLRRRAMRYQISRYLRNFGRNLDGLKKDIVKATQPLITIAEEYRDIADRRLNSVKHYEKDFKDLELAMQGEVTKQEKDIEVIQKEYEKMMDEIQEEIRIFARVRKLDY